MSDEIQGIEPAPGAEEPNQPTGEELESTVIEQDGQETDEELAEHREAEKKPWYRKRFDELTAKRGEAERLAEQERARAERLEAALLQQMQQTQRPPQPEPQAPQYPDTPPIPPDRYMYDTDGEYQQAVAQYQQENLAFVQGQIFRAQQEGQTQYQQQQRQQQIAQGLQGLVAKGAAAHPDFQSVAFVPKGLEDVFVASENGAEIAYHLGKNPAELQRITALSPVQAAYEIAKLDAKLSAPKAAATKAPAPINPVGGNAPAEKDPDKMTIDEWMVWRNKQINQ